MSNSESESTQLIFEETKRLSEIDTTEEQEEEEEELKKRKEKKSYQLHKEYEDFDQAEKDLDDLKINDYKLKHHQFVGDTHYYKCEKNCPVRMYLKLDQTSSKCFLHVTKNLEHNHEQKISLNLPAATKKEVERLINLSKFYKFKIK
jgi:hypothetical protein